MGAIHFFAEDVRFKLKQKQKLKEWLKKCVEKENHRLQSLAYVFCSDESLLEKNKQYLNHKTLTDIITFDLSDQDKLIDGEIYISIDRVSENAHKFSKTFEDELHRVIVHGLLHLVGYRDKKPEEKTEMRKKEDFYLRKRDF